GLIGSDWLRATLRLGLGVIPIGLLLGAEAWMGAGDAGSFERILRVGDPILRYQYRPGADGINALGIADSGHAIPKPPGVYRIVLLGDSVPNDRSIPE